MIKSEKFECKNVYVAYDKKVVVENVSFSVSAGEYVYIVGENGSGKSTLIKGILGLAPLLKGEISSISAGYLPQYTPIQRSFPATVNEVIISGCIDPKKFFPIYTKKDKLKVESVISELKIEKLRNKSIKDLSGGERQKVLLARALCGDGDFLILDEPVNGLDPSATQEMYSVINFLNKEKKKTILMISHDIESALTYADKILHMNKVCEFFGTPLEYLHSEIGKCFVHKHCHGGEELA